ncbi:MULTISPECIES: hypothetical protein [Paenibacillus]|uniref:Lipoprotein n=1 Tax=Paenibacillus odorifer TaxID=189426 RepID=A0ABX3GJQ0_9BACL|nr:hypothetical protein [Paenibacillus odorifer]OMC76827.1 hypothetical protein BK125_17410 [Paenibacillus odorifer]OMD27204.1 hypothetical protein BSO21_20215 [Paenibacillus odorifer]
MRIKLLSFLLILSVLLLGCQENKTVTNNSELYDLPTIPLEIAIVGKNPFQQVENINYKPIELTDLLEEKNKTYDALIVTREYFNQAATKAYQDYFSRIEYPVFFIGTEDILPGVFRDSRLTLNDVEFGKSGQYVSGFVRTNDRYQVWGLDLPENPTEKDKKLNIILRISKIVQIFNNGGYR